MRSHFPQTYLLTGTIRSAKGRFGKHLKEKSMKKTALAGSLLLIAAASTALAGGLERPVTEPMVEEPIAVAPVGSFVGGSLGGAGAIAGGVLGVALLAALLSGGGDDDTTSTGTTN